MTIEVMVSRVEFVEAEKDFTLNVRFKNGVRGIVDMKEAISSPNAGVFAVLADFKKFAEVCVIRGAVAWPGNQLGLDPDVMYQHFKHNGTWKLVL